MAVHIQLSGFPRRPGGRTTALREVEPTPEEARLLALSPAWRPQPSPRAEARPARTDDAREAVERDQVRRVSVLQVANVAIVPGLALVLIVASYVINAGGTTSPLSASNTPLFAASAAGSGKIFVPIPSDVFRVRVAVKATAADVDRSFWCFDRVGEPAPEIRYCKAIEARDVESGGVITDRLIQIPAGAAESGAYAVDLYCAHECTWRVETDRVASDERVSAR